MKNSIKNDVQAYEEALDYAKKVLNRGDRELAKQAVALLSNHDRKVLARACRNMYASSAECGQYALLLADGDYDGYVKALVKTVEEHSVLVVNKFFELVEKRYPSRIRELHERFDDVYGVDLSVLLTGHAPFDVFVTKEDANYTKQVYGIINP